MNKNISLLITFVFCTLLCHQVQAVDIKGNDVEIILDVSGSMAGQLSDGGTKMNVAKNSLATVINQMPENAFVGFRAYGHRSTSANKNCKDSELIYPIGKLSKDSLITKINSLSPGGWTPIDYSLRQAKLDFNNNPEYGKMIILVSDGEETCGGDPCATIKTMRGEGFDVVVNTVGFDVSGIAEDQLKCIAAASGGEYRSAKNASELVDSMTFFSQRAFEGFINAGGTKAGTGFVNAPLVEPGTYGGDIRTSENKFYKINALKGQEIIAALSIKREQVMSDDKSCMCMTPSIKIYDKYKTVIGEQFAEGCAPFYDINGLEPLSTDPSSYRTEVIAEKSGEYYISIGNNWFEECKVLAYPSSSSPEAENSKMEAEKNKKDKAQYDIVIGVEGQDEETFAMQENVIETMEKDLIETGVTDEMNNADFESSVSDITEESSVSMMVMIGIIGTLLGVIFITIIVTIIRKVSTSK